MRIWSGHGRIPQSKFWLPAHCALIGWVHRLCSCVLPLQKTDSLRVMVVYHLDMLLKHALKSRVLNMVTEERKNFNICRLGHQGFVHAD